MIGTVIRSKITKHLTLNKLLISLLPIVLIFSGPISYGQDSIGRGAPYPIKAELIVGPDARGFSVDPDISDGRLPVVAANNGESPADIEPLAIDIYTTTDFYQDSELWSDPRYFRCSSPLALESIWGAYGFPVIGDNPPYTAAWGYCDRDYPREEIVSPYPFATAKEHYEALLQETIDKGGPSIYTQATMPEWNGSYQRKFDKTELWYYGSTLQTSTYLSLLTPEYQERFVQQMYHYAVTNASQWPGSYCWPEGFLRRFSQYGGTLGPTFTMTPNLLQDLRSGTQNYLTQIHIGREFNEEGLVPRLGVDIPRWYGETIGFWDGEVLISWTSNIQPWISHGGMESSKMMQSIEIYTPRKDEHGKVIGMLHETILYDEEALVEPIRIFANMDKTNELGEGNPMTFSQCIPAAFPIEGITTPVSLGEKVEYLVPDLLGRPWAKIWETYHEQGMTKPSEEKLFGF